MPPHPIEINRDVLRIALGGSLPGVRDWSVQRRRRWYGRSFRGATRRRGTDGEGRLAARRAHRRGRQVHVRPALPRLHAITDERIARRADLPEIARELAKGGGSQLAFHARGRALSGREHYDLAARLSDSPTARLFGNDRLDIALAGPTAGGQLGNGSLPVSAARALNPLWWIGRSAHDLAEAEAARTECADYSGVGPGLATAG